MGGLHVALLGIDGIGKSTLAEELRLRCERQGIPVAVTSWRRYIDESPEHARSYPLRSLRNLYVEAYRLLCAGGVDGAQEDGIGTYEDFSRGGGRAALEESTGTEVRPSGPVGAILLELAGHVVFHREVVQELTAQGRVVVDESYGYKHVVKDILFAARVAPMQPEELGLVKRFARQFFGLAIAPDVGLYLAGDPDVAMRRVTDQRGGAGRFEVLPPTPSAPARPESAFQEMQRGCAREFERFAAEYGWVRVPQTEGRWDDNRDRVMAVIARTRLGALLAGSGAHGDGERMRS